MSKRTRIVVMARQAHLVAMTCRCGVSVWWDLRSGEYYALRRDGVIARALAERVSDGMLRAYVGEFEIPVRQHEIEDALLAHAHGVLREAA